MFASYNNIKLDSILLNNNFRNFIILLSNNFRKAMFFARFLKCELHYVATFQFFQRNIFACLMKEFFSR